MKSILKSLSCVGCRYWRFSPFASISFASHHTFRTQNCSKPRFMHQYQALFCSSPRIHIWDTHQDNHKDMGIHHSIHIVYEINPHKSWVGSFIPKIHPQHCWLMGSPFPTSPKSAMAWAYEFAVVNTTKGVTHTTVGIKKIMGLIVDVCRYVRKWILL